MPRDGGVLIIGQHLSLQPLTTWPTKEVVRTARYQMSMQDGVHLILDPCAMPDHLVPPRDLTP